MISFQPSKTMSDNAPVISTSLRFTRDWRRELEACVRSDDDVLILCSKGVRSRGTLELALDSLRRARRVSNLLAHITPDLNSLAENWEEVHSLQPNTLIAIGGGSTIDSAKAVKLMISSQSKDDFIRRVSIGKVDVQRKTNLIAIPTTAGSGSEVTSFATIWDRTKMIKRSIEGVSLIPATAIVDPSLLCTLKGEKLLFPLLDSVSHAMESLWNINRTRASVNLALGSLSYATIALKSYIKGTPDYDSFVQTSVHAGLAIAITRTAIAHSISYPLTLRFAVPHGLACSFTLSAIYDIARPKMALSESEERVIQSILELIEALYLPKRLNRYCSREQVFALSEQMDNLGRSNNFLFQNSQDQLEKILNAST